MEFSEWLWQQLYARGWGQQDLVRRTGISSAQVSNVLNGMRRAGPNFCIAVARAFGIPREVVFQARGWLLSLPTPMSAPDAPIRLVELVNTVSRLPPATQAMVFQAWECMLKLTGVELEPDARESVGSAQAEANLALQRSEHRMREREQGAKDEPSG
jgi:transcriptional regulator with XRE-family HTH domain